MYRLVNGSYLSFEDGFIKGDLLFDKTIKFEEPGHAGQEEILNIDITGLKVIPGLIDIHTHGAVGYDFISASPSDIESAAGFFSRNAVTSFFPTTITAPIETITTAIKNIKDASRITGISSAIEGIHIEGPYISADHRGVHDPSFIKLPDIKQFDNIKNIAGDELRLIFTMAPELPGGMEFIKHAVVNSGIISIGHSGADSCMVKEAIHNGAVSFTHLFNGMKGINHREPGVAGAALNSDCFVELICDGQHVCPDIINLVYKIKGEKRIVLVTDSMQAAGLGDGDYLFGGALTLVREGVAKNSDGRLASSTLILFDAVKNIMKYTGVSLEKAVRMASLNPAKVTGLDKLTGSIESGKRADLAVIDEYFNIMYVFSKGRKVYDYHAQNKG